MTFVLSSDGRYSEPARIESLPVSSSQAEVVESDSVIGGRWIVIIIGAATGVCFAILAGRAVSVLAITPHYFRGSSLVFAGISAWIAYRALEAATSGGTDEESIVRGLRGGIVGGFLGLLVAATSFFSFGQTARTYFTHPLGWHTSDISMFWLSVALLLLGFLAGFVLLIPKVRPR
ncbi:MAG: hypothetical protein JOY79_03695 [Acidobacteriaceae bacterium]|nr:hypothetical protein [Acidobacteriaceae bacterium]